MDRIFDMSRVTAIALAGGEAMRLGPLVYRRAKAAVPMGATMRMIDSTISTVINSGIGRCHVIVQKLPWSLMEHLEGFRFGVAQMRGEFLRVLTPPKREGRFFESDADSLLQTEMRWDALDFEFVVLLMADQLVRVDLRQVIGALIQSGADGAFVYLPVPVDEAKGRLGVLELDTSGRIIRLDEKPTKPKEAPGRPGLCNANLAMFCLKRPRFLDLLERIRAGSPELTLCQDSIPWLIAECNIIGHNLEDNAIPGMGSSERPFFADMGTLDSWYDTQIGLAMRKPAFNLFNHQWPMFTAPHWPMGPAKIDAARLIDRVLLGWNVIVQDQVTATLSVLGTDAIIGRGGEIDHTILLGGNQLGEGCSLSRVVLDKDVNVPPGMILNPGSAPAGTLPFAEVYQLLRAGEQPPNVPVRSENGILFFPKGYTF